MLTNEEDITKTLNQSKQPGLVVYLKVLCDIYNHPDVLDVETHDHGEEKRDLDLQIAGPVRAIPIDDEPHNDCDKADREGEISYEV